MQIVKPSFEIFPFDEGEMLRRIELAGRVCYKSEDRITDGSASKFVRRILKKDKWDQIQAEVEEILKPAEPDLLSKDIVAAVRAKLKQLVPHESVIEHGHITVRIVCDRGVSHELVRHRLASFSQESTRYCNYSKKGLQFVEPCFWSEDTFENRRNRRWWYFAIAEAERCYLGMLKNGATPQEARAVLPNALKTEVVITANLREWRHIFFLRCSKAAHPQMREIMIPLRDELAKRLPEVFG